MQVNTQTYRLVRLDGPWRITFDTNPDDCNHHCVMCEEHSYYSPKNKVRMKGSSKRKRMDFTIIKKVVEECKPLGLQEIIPSTMGEPLLYRDFPGIIQLCHEYDVRLNLTTNGSFPGRHSRDWCELIVPVTSDVKISWNGASREVQEKIMIGSDYEQRLKDLVTLLKARDYHFKNGGNYCSVTLQLTFMEENLHEIPEIVKLAVSHGVDRVKGHHLWVNFNEVDHLNLRRNKDSIRRWNKTVERCREIARQKTLPNGGTIKLDNFHELEPSNKDVLHRDGVCPFLGREAWVNHTGRFDPCCAPDKLRRELGYFGNVIDNGLALIWEGEKYKQLIENYIVIDLCRKCNMRRPIDLVKREHINLEEAWS